MAGKLFIFSVVVLSAALVATCVLLAAPWLPRGGLPYLAVLPWVLISICSAGRGETPPTGTIPAGSGRPQQHCRDGSSERGWEPVRVIAGLRSRRAGTIFGSHQVAATMAYLNTMVLRGAAPRRRAKKHTAPRVGLKCPACFVVGSRRLIIQSRLDPPSRIRDISGPSHSRPLPG